LPQTQNTRDCWFAQGAVSEVVASGDLSFHVLVVGASKQRMTASDGSVEFDGS